MKNKKKEPPKILTFIIVISVIIFILYLSGVFKSEKKLPLQPVSSESTFRRAVMEIFGTQRNHKSSGVGSIQYTETDVYIQYNFYPLGLFNYETELGVELVPKIRKLYKLSGKFDNIAFLIQGPFQDKYGNLTWKPVVSFEFSRETFNKINWENFLNQDLLKVSKNITWSRK